MDTKKSSSRFFWSSLSGSNSGVAAERAEMNEQETRRPLGSNLSALVKDLVRMADLQMQLLNLDVAQFWTGARPALIVGGLSVTALLGAMPVLLLGISGALEKSAGISPESAQMIVAGIIVAAGIAAVRIACMKIGIAAGALKRSQEEFLSNLEWMRNALHRDE